MFDNYYSYKNDAYSCKHCGWNGLGSEAIMGETFDDGFEVNCPNCHEIFYGLILYPSFDATFKHGTEEEKLEAKAVMAFREKWMASLLRDIDQLPDLNDDFLTFVLREIEEDGEEHIVITESAQLIWREVLAYEYYERFIEIGKLLKKKYGRRMIDFVPDVTGYHLYGDRISSLRLIKDFRMELRSNSSN